MKNQLDKSRLGVILQDNYLVSSKKEKGQCHKTYTPPKQGLS